ncbi:MAG: AAA family ATPase, partial [Acidimicrobiales bacterium]
MSTSTAATITVLQAAGAAGVPVLLWGEPGVGKSALVESLATARGVPCEVVVGSTREPADFLGLPVVAGDGSVHMAPPDWFVRLRDAGCGVLFLDELSCAPPAVQAAMLRVARERYVGAERLPEGVSVVAAANPPEQAADGWDLPAPMANRFCHLDYNPALADWLSGMTVGFDSLVEVAPAVASPTKARQAGMRAQVAAFIRRRPDLAQCCPTDPAQAGRAWASR